MQNIGELKNILEQRIKELENTLNKTNNLKKDAKSYFEAALSQKEVNIKHWNDVSEYMKEAALKVEESLEALTEAPNKYADKSEEHQKNMLTLNATQALEYCGYYLRAIMFAQTYIEKKPHKSTDKINQRNQLVESHFKKLDQFLKKVEDFSKEHDIKNENSIAKLQSDDKANDNELRQRKPVIVIEDSKKTDIDPNKNLLQDNSPIDKNSKEYEALENYGKYLSQKKFLCFFVDKSANEKGKAIKKLLADLPNTKDEAAGYLGQAKNKTELNRNRGTGFGKVTTITLIDDLITEINSRQQGFKMQPTA